MAVVNGILRREERIIQFSAREGVSFIEFFKKSRGAEALRLLLEKGLRRSDAVIPLDGALRANERGARRNGMNSTLVGGRALLRILHG